MMPCAEHVEGIVLADADQGGDPRRPDAGCRLPTSQPALDDYDQELVGSAPGGRRLFPEPSDENDGNPGTPVLESPAHEATGVATALTLYWQPSDETDCYQVRFGTSFPLPLLPGCVTVTQLQVTGLEADTTYYWRVIATDSCTSEHSTASVLRSFTTLP